MISKDSAGSQGIFCSSLYRLESCPVSMDMFRPSQSVVSADRDKSPSSGSRSVLSADPITKLLWNEFSLEQPTVTLTGELRYLTPLLVSGNEEPQQELDPPDSSQYKTINEKITEKIRAALKLLAFREEHVLVQYWSARVIGKHQLLTTADQPFGLGVLSEELCFYRRDSERHAFLVDKDDEDEGISAPARVFRRGLPEWTSDITNYSPKQFPQQEYAVRCNLHGYLAIPVVDSTTSLCVGVLEVLMSSKNTGYSFEVQQVHNALKTQNLTSPKVFDSTTPNVPNEPKKKELDRICCILKTMCDIHSLPLAQTWAVSPLSSSGVSRSTLKRFCRENGMPSRPLPKQRKKNNNIQSNSICQVAQLLTVKATFKDDMIKFRFPSSSGLLDLENQVAKRLDLKGKKLSIKYKGENNDMQRITLDNDLHTLPEFSSSNTTVRLLVELACD